jgi:hypothetical protein
MACGRAVLGLIDELLRVFDPEADGKRFRFQSQTGPVQHLKCIPGSVPDGEKKNGSGGPVGVIGYHTLKASPGDLDFRKPGLKPEFSPLFDQMFAQGYDRSPETVRPDMRSLEV